MMFSNIQRLHLANVRSTKYFIDANVWIYALQGDSLLQNWEKAYSDFFYNIIESDLDPKPKILMPTLLFSEILNTFLKHIALPEYKAINGIGDLTPFNYKLTYKSTQHYKDSYEKVCDDILSLRSAILFLNDSSVVTDPPIYINPFVDPFDFNDFFYYSICKEYIKSEPVTILTNDSDFKINDIPIITSNRALLSL
jgi:predicted nucleic acid-binding protein